MTDGREIHERVKTKRNRHILLKDRGADTLDEVLTLSMGRKHYVLAPALMMDKDWIRSGSTIKD